MREPAWIKPVEILSAILCVLSLAFWYWGFGQGFNICNKIKVAQVIVFVLLGTAPSNVVCTRKERARCAVGR
jgi:hypothetical protein